MENLTVAALREARIRTAMSSPAHLKLWLKESGRGWLVINSDELVDALPWPAGVQEVMDLVSLVANHRAGLPSGRTQAVEEPLTRSPVEIPVYKTEELEVPELDRAIRFLIAQIVQKSPSWRLEDSAL